jgi:hypothetical protein
MSERKKVIARSERVLQRVYIRRSSGDGEGDDLSRTARRQVEGGSSPRVAYCSSPWQGSLQPLARVGVGAARGIGRGGGWHTKEVEAEVSTKRRWRQRALGA